MKISVESGDLVAIIAILAIFFYFWRRQSIAAGTITRTAEGDFILPNTGLLIGSYGSRN